MKLILLLFAMLFFASCAKPTYMVDQTYRNVEVNQDNLVVLPVEGKNVHIANMDDFTDDWEEIPKEQSSPFLADKFNWSFLHITFRSILESPVFDLGLEDFTFTNEDSEKHTTQINDKPFEIRVPKKEYLQSKNLYKRFIFLISDLTFGRGSKTYAHNTAMPNDIGMQSQRVTTKNLSCHALYALFDYEKNTFVAAGYQVGESTFTYAMTESDWENSMIDLMDNLRSSAFPF